MKKILLFVFISLILLIVIIFVNLFSFRPLDFELEDVKSVEKTDYSSGQSLIWFALRDSEYHTLEVGTNYFDYLAHLGINIDELNLDLKKYTYIITIGHKLLDIEYSQRYASLRKGIFADQYIGKVLLNKTETNEIFIYRTRKINIDYDIHGGVNSFVEYAN